MTITAYIGSVGRQLLALSLAMTLMACAQPDSLNTSSAESGTEPAAESASPQSPPPGAQPPAAVSELPQLQGEATVELKVKGQTITIQVNGTDAPVTAGNFVDLVERGVYDGTSFHRVVRQPQPFVVQGGDPQSKDPNVPARQLGTGGFIDPDTNKEREIPLEILPEGAAQPIYSQTLQAAGQAAPKLKHTKGAVAMARSQLPDSASSQFYFTLDTLPSLDGSYAVFGTVTEGMDVVEQIQQGDRIESAKVTAGLENLKK